MESLALIFLIFSIRALHLLGKSNMLLFLDKESPKLPLGCATLSPELALDAATGSNIAGLPYEKL